MGMGCPAGVPIPCEIQGNPDLEAETSINKEIGIACDGGAGLTGSMTYFHNSFQDRIAPGLTVRGLREDGGSILRWENTPEAVIEGLEGNVSTDFGGGDFAFNLNLTRMLRSIDKSTGNPLSLVPEHTVNATLDWTPTQAQNLRLSATRYGRTQAAARAVHTGDVLENTDERPSYTLVDLGVTYEVTETALLSAGATNIFDKQLFRAAQEAHTYNKPGRAVYLGLNDNF